METVKFWTERFLGGLQVYLVVGDDPTPLTQFIHTQAEEEGSATFGKFPTEEDFDRDGAGGGAVRVTPCDCVLWLNKMPSVETIGTIAHEAFHVWHAWSKLLNADVDLRSTALSELEKDAYFISDIVEWVYGVVETDPHTLERTSEPPEENEHEETTS